MSWEKNAFGKEKSLLSSGVELIEVIACISSDTLFLLDVKQLLQREWRLTLNADEK